MLSLQGNLALLALIHKPHDINVHTLTLLRCTITSDVLVAAMAHGALGPMSHMQSHKPLSMGIHLGPLLPPATFTLIASHQ